MEIAEESEIKLSTKHYRQSSIKYVHEESSEVKHASTSKRESITKRYDLELADQTGFNQVE